MAHEHPSASYYQLFMAEYYCTEKYYCTETTIHTLHSFVSMISNLQTLKKTVMKNELAASGKSGSGLLLLGLI